MGQHCVLPILHPESCNLLSLLQKSQDVGGEIMGSSGNHSPVQLSLNMVFTQGAYVKVKDKAYHAGAEPGGSGAGCSDVDGKTCFKCQAGCDGVAGIRKLCICFHEIGFLRS